MVILLGEGGPRPCRRARMAWRCPTAAAWWGLCRRATGYRRIPSRSVRLRKEREAAWANHAPMGIARLAGVVLIVAGAAGLAYGGFTYTSDTHSAKVGPVVVKIQERQTVDVP